MDGQGKCCCQQVCRHHCWPTIGQIVSPMGSIAGPVSFWVVGQLDCGRDRTIPRTKRGFALDSSTDVPQLLRILLQVLATFADAGHVAVVVIVVLLKIIN